jgi:hypothetical protein
LSECEINAYFIDQKTIARAFGSKDAALKKKVRKDASGIIANCSGRFDDDEALANAVEQFIDGTPSDDDFLNGFAAWAILAALAEDRPEDPYIEPPGLDAGPAITLWKKNKLYPHFRKLLAHLDGSGGPAYPLPLKHAEAPRPTFAFLDRAQLEEVEPEATAFFNLVAPLFADGLTGNAEVDTNYEIALIAVWLQEAREQERSLLFVVDGDL